MVPVGLYDETSGGLQLQVTDSANGASTYYLNGSTYKAQGGTATTLPVTSCPTGYSSGYTCFGATDLLVSRSAFTSSSGADTISVNYELPTTSGSPYQGEQASVLLAVHAVGAANNPLPSNCAAGSQCNVSISWN